MCKGAIGFPGLVLRPLNYKLEYQDVREGSGRWEVGLSFPALREESNPLPALPQKGKLEGGHGLPGVFSF